jgi:hypothetical protein
MKLIFHIIIKASIIIGIVATCCILALIILLTWKMPLHEYQLQVLQKNFQVAVNAINPAQSSLLAKTAEVGNFGGASNQCDYFAGQFRSSSLPRERLEQIYTNISISSFSGDKNNPLKAEIYFINDDIFEHDPWSDWRKRYLPNNLSAINGNVYLVWVLSESHNPDGDIRCH